MTTITLKRVLAGSTLAVLLLPMAASAHSLGFNLGGGLTLGLGADKDKTQVEGNGDINLNANAKVGNRDDGDKHDKDIKATASASTTAATITKKATRLQDIADFMASFGATLESKLTASGTTSPAVATATTDYKVQLAGAKSQAQTAINTAATLNASSSTSTNTDIAAQAKLSLKAARDFLATAATDLRVMLKFFWN